MLRQDVLGDMCRGLLGYPQKGNICMTTANLAAIVLAAGQGTRMKSDLHKVLHPIGGKPMVQHLLDSLTHLSPSRTVVVIGAKGEQLEQSLQDVEFVTQGEQLGTGHAVQCAMPVLQGFEGDLLVLYGDVPFISEQTMHRMVSALAEEDDCGLVVLGFDASDPAAYGRLIKGADGTLERIVEFKDASPQERAVTLCNSGMMLIEGGSAIDWLAALNNDNAAGEFYLTDLVEIANKTGRSVAVVETDEAELMGINSRSELAAAEAIFQSRMRDAAMADGVSLIAPETVFFSFDTKLGRDVIVEHNVVFAPGVTVEDGAIIKAFSHLEGATVRTGASVGPYARLRPAADIGPGAKIGNFVEIKKASLAEGVKVSHLTYIGDATIGAHANIGAGTITCNYDGFLKYQTTIGAGAFIGSNSALVAPVTIGDNANVGAGSVVTKDVEGDALAVSRARQRNIEGYAAKFRKEKSAAKAARNAKKKD